MLLNFQIAPHLSLRFMLKLQDVPSFSIWANDTLSLALGYAVVFIWIVALLPRELKLLKAPAQGWSPDREKDNNPLTRVLVRRDDPQL